MLSRWLDFWGFLDDWESLDFFNLHEVPYPKLTNMISAIAVCLAVSFAGGQGGWFAGELHEGFDRSTWMGAHASCGWARHWLGSSDLYKELRGVVQVFCRVSGRKSIWHSLIWWGLLEIYIIMYGQASYVWKTKGLSSSKITTCSFVGHSDNRLQPGAKLQVGRMDFGALYMWVEVCRWIWGSLLLADGFSRRPRRVWAFHILLRVIWMIETRGTTARGLMRWCGICTYAGCWPYTDGNPA